MDDRFTAWMFIRVPYLVLMAATVLAAPLRVERATADPSLLNIAVALSPIGTFWAAWMVWRATRP